MEINEFPHVKAWKEKLEQRPAFQKGLQTPMPYLFSDEAVVKPEVQEFCTMVRKMGSQMIKKATEEWKGEVPAVPSDHANYL